MRLPARRIGHRRGTTRAPWKVDMAMGSAATFRPFPVQRGRMVKQTKVKNRFGVDIGLVAMFLKMSPEERLQANENALRTILELRNADRQRRTNKRKSRRNS